MFAVIYSFEVKEDKIQQFEENWSKLTELIYRYEGSLGSRLHKSDKLNYLAYAQWPDKQTWENSGAKLPDVSKEISRRMKEACVKIETTHRLELTNDLLSPKQYKD